MNSLALEKKSICETEPVDILNFETPNLFWYIEKKDILRRKRTHFLLKILMQDRVLMKDPAVGKMGVVKFGEKWARVRIERIQKTEYVNAFICNLMDYFIKIKATTIYNMPEVIKNKPSILKKGMLDGITPNKLENCKKGNFDAEWMSDLNLRVEEILNSASNIDFIKRKNFDGLISGDVRIKLGSERIVLLSDWLVEEGFANRREFQKVYAMKENQTLREFVGPCIGRGTSYIPQKRRNKDVGVRPLNDSNVFGHGRFFGKH